MSHAVFTVTLSGRGFDRLAAAGALRATWPSCRPARAHACAHDGADASPHPTGARDVAKCRFGGVAAPAVAVGSTFAVCLLPPGRQGNALVEFSVNGQVGDETAWSDETALSDETSCTRRPIMIPDDL